MLGFDRITFDPNLMGGRACIRGMRLTVSLILNLVANGMNTEEIIDAYPYLEPEDIRQSLQYHDRTQQTVDEGNTSSTICRRLSTIQLCRR